MKIVQVNAVYGEKSTGMIVRDLDLLIQKDKNQSMVAYRDTSITIDNGIRIGNKLDWSIHALRTRLDGKQAYGSYFATKALLKKLKSFSPDIIHLHNVHSNYLNLPVLIRYAKKKCIPLVLTLHDCWFFTGKCYHFADIECEKWRKECNTCPKRYMDIPSLIRDSSHDIFCDRLRLFEYERLYVVGCSYWITTMATQSPVLRKAVFHTIYNGIDTGIFKPKINAQNNDYFTIVTMANKWFEPKNERARNAVLGFLGETGRLMIVGCSEEKQKAYASDRRVSAIGYVKDRKDLASIYAQGDVFLNLTHIDTLPTVNMEALGCGTPVVTYDVGGSGELVRNGFTGYVVEADNICQLIEAMGKVRQGIISRHSCRQYALDHFDRDRNYQKYLDLYREILEKGNA